MESKLCPKCNKEKPLDSTHWYRNISYNNGFSYICKICDKKRLKANKDKKKEIVSESSKALYEALATKQMLEASIYELNKRYLVYTSNTKQLTRFKGEMVGETERFIVLKEETHGYLESFMKIDFITGEKRIKEVV